MLSEHVIYKARIELGDTVEFSYRRKRLCGTVLRCNSKRAVIEVEREEYTVPYELLIPMSGNGDERIRRIEDVVLLADELMQKYGLRNWKFELDHSTRRAGSCRHRDKRITLAFELARNGSEQEVRDTILHEIAHALVGAKHHHDAVWKNKALEIGCSGERTHMLRFAPPRWTVTCENRCWVHTAQQRNSRLICRSCGGKLVYAPFSATA